MLPYWALFAIVALAAMLERADFRWRRFTSSAFLFGFALALMIGFRHEVGGDYYQYLAIFELTSRANFLQALDGGDIGYQALNWIVAQLGGELWVVNLVSGCVFSWGLMRLAAHQPYRWLAVLIAVPYLIIVVSMGYTRQAMAIGIIMAGLASLGREGAVLRFAIYVAIAALFHRTAVMVLPFAIFAGQRNQLLNLLALGGIGYGLYDLLLADNVELLVENYLDARYESQGALIRVLMLALPAAVILLNGRNIGLSAYERRLWSMTSVVAIVCLPALFILPSSTAVDRMALYLLPLQMVALSRVPIIVQPEGMGRLLVLAYSALILFVWLNFAVHARYWVPYQLYDFGGYELERAFR